MTVLKVAYLQVSMDEESNKYLVIITQKGYFTYNRLPFDIKTAPKIFQSFMDQLLNGLDKITWSFDDICIEVQNTAEQIERLCCLKYLKKN